MKTLIYLACIGAIAIVFGLTAAHTQSAKTGDLQIENAFSRATPGGSKVGAGYMTITNTGKTPDRLISVASPAAAKIEIHEMAMKGTVMNMRPLDGALPIGPGKTVTLAPGGFHLMMMGLKAPLKQGDKVPLTLTFEKAGKVDVILDVQAIGAQPPGGTHYMHKM